MNLHFWHFNLYNKLGPRFYLIIVSLILVGLSCGRYAALASNVFDAGVFQSGFFNFDFEIAQICYGHIQPLIILWASVYKLLPINLSPYVLFSFQVLVLCFSVIIVWKNIGWPAGIALSLYYPIWSNALLDFHFDHLCVPLMAAFFVACKRRKFTAAALFGSCIAFIKEPFALQTVACGIYLMCLAFQSRSCINTFSKIIFCAVWLCVFGSAYFYISIHWLLPYYTDTKVATETSVFNWLGSGPSSIVKNVLTHPEILINEIITTPAKILYLGVLFGSLAFIPLVRPFALIPALPVLLIAMMARGQPLYYSYANHYTAGAIIPIIVSFQAGIPAAHRCSLAILKQLDLLLQRGWLISKEKQNAKKWTGPIFNLLRLIRDKSRLMQKNYILSVVLISWLILAHVMLASSPISRLFWSDKVWSYSWRAYVSTMRTDMIKAAILKYIPATPSVSVSTQNSVNWGYLAHRRLYLPFPFGVKYPHQIMSWSNRSLSGLWLFISTGYKPPAILDERFADYVVLDLKRPFFIGDKGCEWIYGECKNKLIENEFLDLVSFTCQRYKILYDNDGFMILSRK